MSHTNNHKHHHNHSCCGGAHVHQYVGGVCSCGKKESKQDNHHDHQHHECQSQGHSHETITQNTEDDSGEGEPSDSCHIALDHDQCGCTNTNHSESFSETNHLINDSQLEKIEIKLEGLHCASCASKIEKKVSDLNIVKNVIMNFATSTLTIQAQKANKQEATKKAIKIAEETEAGVKAFVKDHERTRKKTYTLSGLNCSSCAAKIERNINTMDGVISAELNFATSTLNVITKTSYKENITNKITKLVKDLEPDVNVIDQSDTQENIHKVSTVHNDKKKVNPLLIRIAISIALTGAALFLKENYLSIFLYVTAYIVIGSDIIKRSFNNIKRGEIFDENFLMTIATLAAIGIGEYPEAIMVMLLYQVGEYFQDRAVESSRKSISDLMDIRPEYANIKMGSTIKKAPPTDVGIGDIIIVKPGEKVPLDGVIIDGSSSVDTKALTGESIPVDVETGDEITSGSININGLLTVEVTKEFNESAVSKILDLVQNASAKKAKTELRITKFAKYYTPVVVLIAFLTAIIPPLLTGQSFNEWILRAATFLVVSCPCAFVISIPMTYFAGLGASSRNGVLVKGGNYLEALSKAGILVFDKTGTLTEGKFKVDRIMQHNGISSDELLRLTAHVESFSTHPIAISIVNAYKKEIDKSIITDYKETRGKGVEAIVDGIHVISGNAKFLMERGYDVKEEHVPGTIVYTVINNQYAGCIAIKDQLKKDAKLAVEHFATLGIDNVIMLTGDRKITAEAVAKTLGIKKFKYELLPDQKVEQVEKLIAKKGDQSLVFVGDGINDAPVLARADIGVAMGGVGSDAAIEAADMVIMNDEPSKLYTAIKIARKTKRIANQNIFLSISIKLVIMILAFFGYAPMWVAVFGDVGVSIIAVFNAMRVLRSQYQNS